MKSTLPLLASYVSTTSFLEYSNTLSNLLSTVNGRITFWYSFRLYAPLSTESAIPHMKPDHILSPYNMIFIFVFNRL